MGPLFLLVFRVRHDPLVHRVSKQNVLVERGVFWFLQKCLSAMLTRSAVATQTLWRRGEFCSAAMLTIQQWPRGRFGEEEISGSGRRSIVTKIMEPNTDTLYCRHSSIVVLKTSPQKVFFKVIVAHVPRHQQNTLRVLNVFLHLWNEESTYILYIIICVEALPWKTPWENMRKQSSLFLLSHPVTLYWFTSMPSTLKQCFFSVFPWKSKHEFRIPDPKIGTVFPTRLGLPGFLYIQNDFQTPWLFDQLYELWGLWGLNIRMENPCEFWIIPMTDPCKNGIFYLPFSIEIHQMWVIISYMDPMGLIHVLGDGNSNIV